MLNMNLTLHFMQFQNELSRTSFKDHKIATVQLVIFCYLSSIMSQNAVSDEITKLINTLAFLPEIFLLVWNVVIEG